MSFLKNILRLQNLSYYGQSIKLMQQVKRERNALKGLSDEQLSDIGKTKREALKEIQQGYRIPTNRRITRVGMPCSDDNPLFERCMRWRN